VKKTRILVAEDSPVIAGMIRHFLMKCDYSIAGMVTTGEEAVEMAGASKPDVVLMDVELAGEMDGIEAAGSIWQQFHIPIVYLTANDDQETISRASLSQAYGFLCKPIQAEDLHSTLQIVLSRHQFECRAKENEKWLATTLQCIADAVIAADSMGCVKLVNPSAQALVGWKQEEAIGQDLLDVFSVLDCETRQPAECVVVEVIRDGAASLSGRTRILVARDGTERTVEERAAPIVNDSGQIIGVVLIFRLAKR
jgi:PAS domain S-box-containing protein